MTLLFDIPELRRKVISDLRTGKAARQQQPQGNLPGIKGTNPRVFGPLRLKDNKDPAL